MTFMKTQIFQTFLVGGLMTAAFLFGRGVSSVEAQQGNTGRGPTRPSPVTPTNPEEPPMTRQPLVYESSTGGAASSSDGFLAVTGSYGVGTSVLYLVDTKSQQLAVYEARGGSKSMRRLVLVGARRIDLDLQIEGYNDESEYDYAALRKRVEKGDRKKARSHGDKATTNLERR